MKSNQLTAEQILPWSNASWDCDGLFALIRDQAIDTPFCAVEGIFGDLLLCQPLAIINLVDWGKTNLEPTTPNPTVRLRIADLLQIRHNRTLMARVDDIVGSRRQSVAPGEGCRGAGLHSDDSVSFSCWIGAAVADDIV
jgi:hypothetical protein